MLRLPNALRCRFTAVSGILKRLEYIVLLICLVGCGQSNPYGTTYVEGIVLIDGSPIDGVQVTFAPNSTTSETQQMSAGGMTDKSGKFTLTTGGAPLGSGVLAGEYNVTFYKITVKETTFEESQAGKEPVTTYIVPQKYNDTKTSDITPVKVEKGDKNSFKFELKTN
ncbi:MAG: hypothetical protein LBJ00_17020 [Planctomycetaceae bacterium]|nr:hypothetical protein [Planctomycetaceae bacterium]